MITVTRVIEECSLQDVNIFSFWFSDRKCRRATTQNLHVRKHSQDEKNSGWDGSLIILRQPRKSFAQVGREDYVPHNKLAAYVPETWPGWDSGMWKEVWGNIIAYMSIPTLNGSEVIWQSRWKSLGLLGTPAGLLKGLNRQVGNAWCMYSCHWRLWLTHQPEKLQR